MATFTIRPANTDDIGTLVRHRRMMWWDMGRQDENALKMVDLAAREYFSAAIPDGSYRGFVAVDDNNGEIVGGGGIVISKWPGSLGQCAPLRAMILNVYVERDYRRRGIARTLMQTMIAWCREQQFAYVGLHASDEGRPLYESLGFRPTNEMRLDLL
jgi:GNAT superfamily N-acetyltransferase